MDLMSFVRQTMFDSVVRQLFGASNNLPQTEAGMRELERKFVKFDKDFEYGTQLPEFLIRSVKITLGKPFAKICEYKKFMSIQGLE